MPGQSAKVIEDLKLLKELTNSVGRDDISAADVTKLEAMVYEVADIAGPLLNRIPGIFKHYTEHNIEHCRNILDLMGRFIPSETLKQMNALELSILILTALLHDFGMFVSDEDKEEVLHNESSHQFFASHHERWAAMKEAEQAAEKEKYETLRDALLADYFRRRHPERVLQAIRENLAGKLHFYDVDLTDTVARLCESHGWGVYESTDPHTPKKAVKHLETEYPIYGYPVNLQYIAVCLRLADIMDFDRSRTPLAVFQNLKFADPQSWKEWNKHLQVRGWKVDEREVSFATECVHPAFYVAVMEFLDWVDAELGECRRLVAKEAPKPIADRYQLHLPPVVERWKVEMKDKRYLAGAFRFQLEYERIMQLLMDKSLYPDPSLFLRELLQNSLDACRNMEALYKANNTEALYQPRIAVWDYSGDPDRPRVVFQDNGIGMSLNIVENYFMRVGRSYYRSAEFDVERERLRERGVELEACSQFGIGILSCFMVADRFEVETYRLDHKPLRVIIEGPTKYFTIEVQDEPPRTIPVRPASDQEDGPPKFPGTRITVFLRPDTSIDTLQTLKQFAVNIDYDIAVYRQGQVELETIEKWGWEKERIPVEVMPNAYKIKHSRESITTPLITENLRQVLAPSIIPFQRYEFTRHLRGCAWIWLLKDELGNGCPQRGYLKISDTIDLIGLPKILSNILNVFSMANKQPDSEKWQTFVSLLHADLGRNRENLISSKTRKQFAAAYLSAYLGDVTINKGLLVKAEKGARAMAEMTAEMVFEGLNKLIKGEQETVIDYLKSFSSGSLPWFESPELMHELLEGSGTWTKRLIKLDNALELIQQEFVALHGILLPGGFVKWNPMAGQASKLNWLPVPGGFFLDLRGTETPIPAASRLFVLEHDAQRTIVPIARAMLRHAIEIAYQSPNDENWEAWINHLFSEVESLPFWPEAIWHEFTWLNQNLRYRVKINRESKKLGLVEIIQQMGRWVPIRIGESEERSSDPTQFIERDSKSNLLLAFFPKRRLSKNFLEIDLENPAPTQAKTLGKAAYIPDKEAAD